MSKWIAIPIIVVLAVGLIAIGVLYLQETNKLKDAESKIGGLEGNVSTLEAQVSTLQADLAAAEAEVSTLEGDLADAEAQVSALEARMSPELNLSPPAVDGLTVTVDGVVTPGIDDSTITRVHWDWG